MKRLLLIVVAIGITVELFASLQTEMNSSLNVPKSQCGINSLYFCLRYFGHDMSFEKLHNDIPTNSNNEVNLKQLADYARQKGLFAKGIKSPTLEIIMKHLARGECVILHWTKNIGSSQLSHIMPIVKIPDKGILVFDFPINKRYFSKEDLLEYIQLSNAALVLSAEKKMGWIQADAVTLGIAIVAGCLVCIIIVSCVYKNIFFIKRKTQDERLQ